MGGAFLSITADEKSTRNSNHREMWMLQPWHVRSLESMRRKRVFVQIEFAAECEGVCIMGLHLGRSIVVECWQASNPNCQLPSETLRCHEAEAEAIPGDSYVVPFWLWPVFLLVDYNIPPKTELHRSLQAWP